LWQSFTDETLDYFVCKIRDHRQPLLEIFPGLGSVLNIIMWSIIPL